MIGPPVPARERNSEEEEDEDDDDEMEEEQEVWRGGVMEQEGGREGGD